jgi:hypothetical protein
MRLEAPQQRGVSNMGSPVPAQNPWDVPIQLPVVAPPVQPQPQPAAGLAAMLGQVFSKLMPTVQTTQQIAGPQAPMPQTTPEEQIQRRELFKKFGNPQ